MGMALASKIYISAYINIMLHGTLCILGNLCCCMDFVPSATWTSFLMMFSFTQAMDMTTSYCGYCVLCWQKPGIMVCVRCCVTCLVDPPSWTLTARASPGPARIHMIGGTTPLNIYFVVFFILLLFFPNTHTHSCQLCATHKHAHGFIHTRNINTHAT